MLRNLACPSCGAPTLQAQQPDGAVVCRSCGSGYAPDDRLACPRCEALNEPADDYCGRCGEKLKRNCPACAAENWSGADYCAHCGRSLDALEYMAGRTSQSFRATLEHQRRIAGSLKAEEEASSQKRMAQLWDIEKRRQTNLAQQQAKQKAEQEVLLRIMFVGLVLFVLALLGLAVAAYWRG